MLSKCLLSVCAAAVLANPVQAQSFLEWKGLTPGPHAVGFRVAMVADATRTIRRTTTPASLAEPSVEPRRLQVATWYPAASPTSGGAMTYADYLPLLSWGAVAGRETGADRRDAALKYIQTVTPMAGPPAPAELERLFAGRLAARKDADPAPGRFPVLIYAPGYGYPAFDNSVLCEYLASHGYVVVASPSVGADGRRMTGDAVGMESQVRDLEFLAGYVRTLPYADPDRLATAGFSWGGLASTLFALRHSEVRALVSWDGVIRETSSLELARTFPHFKPARLRTPTLVVALAPERASPGFSDASFIDQATYADITTAVVFGLDHHDLATMSNLLRRGALPGQAKDWTAATAGYEAACRQMRRFLDVQLGASSQAQPTTPDAPTSVIVVSSRKAAKAPPLSEDFYAVLDGGGAARAADLIRLTRQENPEALQPFEAVLNEAGYERLAEGRARDAIVLLEVAVECFPQSLNALDSLAEAYLAAGQLDKAEACYVSLRVAIDKSGNLSPAAKDRARASVEKALARVRERQKSASSLPANRR